MIRGILGTYSKSGAQPTSQHGGQADTSGDPQRMNRRDVRAEESEGNRSSRGFRGSEPS